MRFVRRRQRRSCKGAEWNQPWPIPRTQTRDVDLASIDKVLRER